MGLMLFKVSQVKTSATVKFPRYIFADSGGDTSRESMYATQEAKRLLLEWCTRNKVTYRSAMLNYIDMANCRYLEKKSILAMFAKNDGSVLISPKKKIPAFFTK